MCRLNNGTRRGEEVDGGDVFDVVVNEDLPGLGRWLAVLIMYCSTVDFATFKPSSASSSRILGEPQSGFSREIRRISSRISGSTLGRPGFPARDFHRQ